ncbi:MAG: Kdo(2)-lipid IV(A) acyltransferase [Pseudomonadota bacterium]|uniref:Lipid A biosynthesis acyltransferase n=1 Tax=Providencia stuartii TaxID=588 RepID=A0AAI9DEB8_PROST|nr:Kdo(2)-lipid IV(A) acyltransferase [Providencia stuartii]ELR5039825.1 LpxL/LpxP family Kdo(2)-lipid IV(A) lauroyl/palmitoleoyl acyltransferasee [Providencia stuartii]ELR5084043.1 LpxL/LpxP family Kdo(2)-lipid IV(A) lauroyl/palmitoleoyl acyltransferasee [Providencia stuartii]ELR5114215.1 LpxL/LpxP family Kdo(2)-lipid IV(A) lauroyl/palmitoleoyl acyltransferasee [Providencia stuartii]MDV5225201.1 Kdo(2)-lipid IV(A) acyltransferase [Providencia rettgeri]
MIQAPKFNKSLLHPRYWLTWLGIGLLYVLILLPYPMIYWIGTRLGLLSKRFLKKRAQIADRNLELCFPEMSLQERQRYIDKNFESVGMGLFETGMAWFWPEWRIRRWCRVEGRENMLAAQETGRGIIVLGIHFLTLEMGGRTFGMLNPGIGVYRPNDNKLLDWIQTRGRLRANKYMLDRKDVKGMVRVLKQGEIVWYAPDHDYGPRNSSFAPLFAVPNAATTNGSAILLRLAKPLVVPFTLRRLPAGKGYELLIQPAVDDFPIKDEVAVATKMNKIIETEILRAPEQYMWLHRRFKTRPKGEPSLYGDLDKIHH